TYLLRGQPEHGQLSEIKQIDQQSARVLYQPPTDLAITQDRFFFSVKSTEGVSARAEVRITIVDDPPRIVAAAELEFPAILSGEKSVRELEVRNRGGGVAQGELLVPPPWRVLDSPAYRLESGERRQFRVEFAPADGGSFQGDLRFSSQPDRATHLRGVAHPPLEVVPPRLELARTSRDLVRTGSFEIVNRTTVDQTATLSAAPRLKLPGTLVVPAQGKAAVAVHMAADDLAALEETVRVSAAPHSAQCIVHAAAVPAILSIQPETLRFGRLSPKALGRLGFEIANTGGTAASLQWEAAPPLSLEPEVPHLLGPGERKRGVLRFAGAAAGNFHGVLRVKAAQEVLEVRVEAEVGESAGTKSRQASGGSAPIDRPPATPSPWAPAESAAASRPYIAEITPTRCVIEWPISMGEAPQYRAMTRQLDLDEERKLRITWKAYPAFSTQSFPDRIRGTFTDLEPRTLYAMRIHAALPGGEAGEELFDIAIATPPLPDFPITWRGCLVAGGVVLVAASLLWQWRRRRTARL
ncbi:MAG: hypothetical protein M3463_17985, partial [Verrucomicrobiota bacterium]|nr:hypothetical protein [Verrucomicrobiota bacterium]